MRKMWPVFAVLFLTIVFLWLAGSASIAMDQCEVVGESYTITLDGDEWILDNFVIFGPFISPAPRCCGTVNLLSPDGEYVRLDWRVTGVGLNIAGFPATLTSNGLKLYCVPLDLYVLHIGNTIYMTEQEVQQFFFK